MNTNFSDCLVNTSNGDPLMLKQIIKIFDYNINKMDYAIKNNLPTNSAIVDLIVGIDKYNKEWETIKTNNDLELLHTDENKSSSMEHICLCVLKLYKELLESNSTQKWLEDNINELRENFKIKTDERIGNISKIILEFLLRMMSLKSSEGSQINVGDIIKLFNCEEFNNAIENKFIDGKEEEKALNDCKEEREKEKEESEEREKENTNFSDSLVSISKGDPLLVKQNTEEKLLECLRTVNKMLSDISRDLSQIDVNGLRRLFNREGFNNTIKNESIDGEEEEEEEEEEKALNDGEEEEEREKESKEREEEKEKSNQTNKNKRKRNKRICNDDDIDSNNFKNKIK